jgi:hypothetical protein
LIKFEITQFSLTFGLNKISKTNPLKKEVFECIKNSLGNISELNNAKTKYRPHTIMVNSQEFELFFNSSDYILMGSIFKKEETVVLVNSVFNKILNKLLEKNFKADLGVTIISTISAKISKEFDVFSYLLNQDTLKKLFEKDNTFIPKKLEIWQPPNDKLRKGFYVRREQYDTFLDSIRSDFYKDISADAGEKIFSASKNQFEEFFEKLSGDNC